MSYNFDGKVVNQDYSYKSICACCRKIIDRPESACVKIGSNHFRIRSYIGTPYYIYEAKGGQAVVYCSDECRRKHNHRFKRR